MFPDASQIVFGLTALLIVVSALFVVTARNLVHAALWLIATFAGMAVLFVLLNAGFLALVQVVVYIGAISILIIFAIMLTRRVMQDTGPQTNANWYWGAVVAGLVFVGSLVLLSLPNALTPGGASVVPGFSQAPPVIPPEFANAADFNTATLANLGLALSSPDHYLLPLLLVGALLAVAMVGSINIARDDKERE
ncbi:MAG TPA: NADH-quinone oxidoreductase subunit J [Anaerolineales bacterium]|nr:NADH-quinone oxidoreductase subunit J [Anaerolineales bacterium]